MFKVGDIVKVNSSYTRIDYKNKTGKVVNIISKSIGVKFNKIHRFGHNCDGHCEEGYGRYFSADEITIVTNKPKLKYEDLIL